MEAAIVGAGPAGLMAADILGAAGAAVTVYERMPSPGRKFLMAGRGGLNLTHSEPFAKFLARYGAAADRLRPILEAFPPERLVAWAEGLGQPTFKGSSGRIFPKALKASPLLRAWLARLAGQDVQMRTHHTWRGWDDSDLVFDHAGARVTASPGITILALGGASWPRLGSDGGWADILRADGIAVTPLAPANCGFTIAWSEPFRTRFAGTPLKNIALSCGETSARGEAMIAGYGLEGGAIYALSAPLRDAIASQGSVRLHIDLRPDLSEAKLAAKLGKPASGQSLANHLRKTLSLSPAAINLLREAHGIDLPSDPAKLAAHIKHSTLTLTGTAPIARAISTAGGIAFAALDENLMLRARPGVYAVGEMLDWEAPTGGYLLQACVATGAFAARAALVQAGIGKPHRHWRQADLD